MSTANNKKVFVVYGRNKRLMQEMYAFLKMLGLSPIPWEDAVLATEKSAAYVGETVDSLLHDAQAVVVLLTGDDEVQMRREFMVRGDPDTDRVWRPQPRANVVFEAGMAFSDIELAPHTILVETGKVRLCPALEGRHRIKISNKLEDRWTLIRSLEAAGCAVEIPTNRELLREIGDFNVE